MVIIWLMMVNNLVGGWPTPLKNMTESQLGLWNSQLNGKIKHVQNHQPDPIWVASHFETFPYHPRHRCGHAKHQVREMMSQKMRGEEDQTPNQMSLQKSRVKPLTPLQKEALLMIW